MRVAARRRRVRTGGVGVDRPRPIRHSRVRESIRSLSVARATFTNGVADREPLDSITEATNDSPTIYFFSELRNLSGETITHRWEHDGQVMAEIPFHVGGSRWRVWSSKNLEPSWVGEWKVSVTRSDGTVIESKRFHYADSSTVPANPAE